MIIQKKYVIPGCKEKSILIDIRYDSSSNKIPVVIFVHGFKGFKDWGHFNLVSEQMADAGFLFIKFNFSYNGTTLDNPSEFGDLDAFGNNNYIIELDDLGKVIDWVTQDEEINKLIDPNQIYLIGHSRGGGISILKACEDPRIKKLVTWASVSDILNRNNAKTIREWKEKGVVHTMNARTKQNMPLYYQFYQTILENKERLDIETNVSNLKIPFLIIHGTKDEAVHFQEAQKLHLYCPHSKLLLIENGNHTFGAKHPFEEKILSEDAATVVNNTISFLKEKAG